MSTGGQAAVVERHERGGRDLLHRVGRLLRGGVLRCLAGFVAADSSAASISPRHRPAARTSPRPRPSSFAHHPPSLHVLISPVRSRAGLTAPRRRVLARKDASRMPTATLSGRTSWSTTAFAPMRERAPCAPAPGCGPRRANQTSSSMVGPAVVLGGAPGVVAVEAHAVADAFIAADDDAQAVHEYTPLPSVTSFPISITSPPSAPRMH